MANVKNLSDEQLIQNAKSGHAAVCEQLLEKYHGAVYNFAFAMLGNTEDAKNTAHESFVKVFKMLQKPKKNLDFSTHLYKTACALGINELKVRRKERKTAK